jgi:hypothetical protein
LLLHRVVPKERNRSVEIRQLGLLFSLLREYLAQISLLESRLGLLNFKIFGHIDIRDLIYESRPNASNNAQIIIQHN